METIEKIAGDASRAYGIDQEEATGLLSVEVAQHIQDYLILFNEAQVGLLEKRLMNVAARKARAERVRKMMEAEAYFYDPEYIRLFLPFFFEREDWDNGPVNEDTTAEWKTGEAVDTALDIKRAWPRLKGWQKNLICARHLEIPPNLDGGVDWDAIADLLVYKSAESARVSYQSATRELTTEMNDARLKRIQGHEGPGARRAISNAKASTLID